MTCTFSVLLSSAELSLWPRALEYFFRPRLYRPRGLHGAIVARMVPSTFRILFFCGATQGADKGKHQGRQNPVSLSPNPLPPLAADPCCRGHGEQLCRFFIFIFSAARLFVQNNTNHVKIGFPANLAILKTRGLLWKNTMLMNLWKVLFLSFD